MAHHKPFGKPLWSASQKAEVAKLQSQSLEALHVDAGRRYDIITHALPKPLPIDASVLDIGCGAVCTAKLFNAANTTYLDPLADNFKRLFPGKLPTGEFITQRAEEINKPDDSYDLILCLNTLSYTHNPELVLHEIRRILKTDGTFAISLTLWPELFARLHYIKMRFFSLDKTQSRLYCYTYKGIKNTLQRHFNIIKEIELEARTPSFGREHMFICQRKKSARNHGL